MKLIIKDMINSSFSRDHICHNDQSGPQAYLKSYRPQVGF